MMTTRPPKLPPILSKISQKDSLQDAVSSEKIRSSNSYTLGIDGSHLKHILPAERSLKPSQDTTSGDIDTWPAHASRSVSDSALVGASFQGVRPVVKSPVIPKPKFLAALESYVKKEIVQLNCTDPEPSELRLQAYREVFEYLIDDFKTYKPLLSQIKNEYEKMLSIYRQRIRELEPLKSMLITVSEQCDQKILKIREEERQEIKELRENKMQLLHHIDSMREKEISLQAQVARLQEELATEYRNYRNECDMRKLLVSDLNDLRHQQEDLKRAAGQGVDEADDPVRLKLSLQVARQDLTRQAEELIRIKADYGDVVPRRDFLALETKYAELEEKQQQLRKDFVQLQDEHETLQEVHKQVLEQRDEYYTDAETLRRSATPRPHWNLCGDVVPGGADKWSELTDGKKSEEILAILLKELKGGGSQGPDTFEGKGLSEDVPKYLRYEGDIRNRKMRKSEVTSLLKEIWAKKVQSDEEKGSRQVMTDFLHQFFLEKFNNTEDLAAEWGYSLFDALNNYKEEVHVKIFLDVVTGEGTEDVYYQQMDLIKRLMEELKKSDSEATGKVNTMQFNSALSSAFPLKPEASLQALTIAAVEELEVSPDSSTVLDHNALFTEDEEGHTGPFLNLLRQQEDEERETYVSEIAKNLEGMEQVPLSELKSAIQMNDPIIDRGQMMNYLQIAYKSGLNDLDEAEPVDLTVLLDRLKKGGIHRVGAVY